MNGTMNCPDCGSECYDNRQENVKRKAAGEKPRPEYKCKACEWVQWPPKEPKAPKQGTSVPKPGRLTWRDLEAIYGKCLDICVLETARLAKAHSKLGMPSWDNIMAGTATLFIQATKAGLTVRPEVKPPQTKEEWEEPPFPDEPPEEEAPF